MVSKNGPKSEEQDVNLGLPKKLASCDKKTRDRALDLLVRWLSSREVLTDLELRKIWKGLFYCVWHADKAPVQADLNKKLASLISTLQPEIGVRFFETFLLTVKREWHGIDHLRLDKFYQLLRKCLGEVFRALNNLEWDEDWVKKFMDVLWVKVSDAYVGQGVNLHIAEIYLEELRPFLPVDSSTLGCLLDPFYRALSQTEDKLLLQRVKECIFSPLLEEALKTTQNPEDDELELGNCVLSLEVGSTLLELAGMSSTPQPNRKVLYDVYQQFQKLEKVQQINTGAVSSSKKRKNKKVENGTCSSQKKKSKVSPQENPSNDSHSQPGVEENVSKNNKVENGTCSSEKKKSEVSPQENISNDGNSQPGVEENISSQNQLTFDDPVVSNLVGKFENVAAVTSEGRAGLGSKSPRIKKKKKVQNALPTNGGLLGSPETPNSSVLSTPSASQIKKKKKRNVDELLSKDEDLLLSPPTSAIPVAPLNTASKKKKVSGESPCQSEESPRIGSGGKSGNSKSPRRVKRVRFSLKNNLIWKPHSPLPPASLRVPPSSTPKGSALKKGLSPGPILKKPSPKRQSPKKHSPRLSNLRGRIM